MKPRRIGPTLFANAPKRRVPADRKLHIPRVLVIGQVEQLDADVRRALLRHRFVGDHVDRQLNAGVRSPFGSP
jgi:hypothetical protein